MIAVIPARSGSKGLPDKNIKLLAGKPLLSYSIEAALKANIFDTVMVSTDSERYAEIAKKYGAEVPFLRSEETASDAASTRDCIIEVLDKYKALGKNFDKVMILQPTSPLRTSQNIIDADLLYKQRNAKSVISVNVMDHSIEWCNTLGQDLSLKNFLLPEKDLRRQDMKQYYMLNGSIYLHDVDYYYQHKYCFDERAFAYIMSREQSIDIDTILDFKFAEVLIKETSPR